MAVYSDEIAMVIEDINEDGELCEFTLPPTKADASKPWKDAPASADPTTQPLISFASVLFVPAGRVGYETLRELAGTEVPKGFELGYMAATFEPSLKHLCKRASGIIYAIRSNIPFNPNGELIFQTLLFQRQ